MGIKGNGKCEHLEQRPLKVIYDRAYSSIALAKRNEFDWDGIFEGADWFHWTVINPALSEELALICEDACAEEFRNKLRGFLL